jgi:hypothetical protein
MEDQDRGSRQGSAVVPRREICQRKPEGKPETTAQLTWSGWQNSVCKVIKQDRALAVLKVMRLINNP